MLIAGSRRLFPLLEQLVAHLGQPLQFAVLHSEPVGVARLVAGAGHGRGLLDQLPDVVARNRDAVVDLVQGQGTVIGHGYSPASGVDTRLSRHGWACPGHDGAGYSALLLSFTA